MVAVNTFQDNILSSLSAHPPRAAQKVGTLKDLPPAQKKDILEWGFGVHGNWDERERRRNLMWEALVLPKDDLQNL